MAKRNVQRRLDGFKPSSYTQTKKLWPLYQSVIQSTSGADAHHYQEKLGKAAISRSKKMKADCLKFVQWSAAGRLFVGYCPDLFIGGVCHGSDEQKVYRELSRRVAEEIAESERARRVLPAKRALVTVPVAA